MVLSGGRIVRSVAEVEPPADVAVTDIVFSASTVPYDAAEDTVLCVLSSPGATQPVTYSIVGGDDAALGYVDGNVIRAVSTLAETPGDTLDIDVQGDNGVGSPHVETWAPTVIDPEAAVKLATWKLVKTDDSTVSAGAVPKSVGLAFRKGDIPAGTWPQLRTSGATAIPYTAWGVNTWTDGSMKRMSALIQYPDAISGGSGATIDVEVWSNGGAPASASPRALSDISAADVKLEVTGTSNLTGTWTSAINTGASDNDDVTVLGDGPAGKIVRVGQQFRDGSGDHGQLYCWWYVFLLNGPENAFAGARVLGWAVQPWADVPSPTPTTRSMSAVLKANGSNVRTILGSNGSGGTQSAINMDHYSGWYTCGANGEYDYIAGAVANDAPLRWEHDRTYLTQTRLVPPYELSLGAGTTALLSYVPYGKGALEHYDFNAGGERDELGIVPAYFARQIVNPSAQNERGMRVGGLEPAHWRQTAYLQSTMQVPSLNARTYAGMGTAKPTWQYRSGGATTGFASPAAHNSYYTGDHYMDHRPGLPYVPYLLTGEPHWLDLLVPVAHMGIAGSYRGVATFYSPGGTGKVIGANGSWSDVDFQVGGKSWYLTTTANTLQPARSAAWKTRDACNAAAALPDVCPRGTGVQAYYADIVHDSFEMILAFVATRDASYQTSGVHYFRDPDQPYEGTWTHSYMLGATTMAYCLTEDPGAGQYMNYLARLYGNFDARGGNFAQAFTYSYRCRMNGGAVITSFDQVRSEMTVALTANATNDTWTAAQSGVPSWTPTNGDRISVLSAYSPPRPAEEVAYNEDLFVVEASGQTCKISKTLGGSAIDITNVSTPTSLLIDGANVAGYSFENANTANAYVALVTGAIQYALAAGCETLANAPTKAVAKRTDAGVSFSNNPKNAIRGAF